MATRSGEPTNATFGFLSMLLTVLKEQQPDYIAVAFDVGKTFRHQDYADYKGTRSACLTTCANRWSAFGRSSKR